MKCPNCQSKNLGNLSPGLYYCWECFIEINCTSGVMSLNQVEEDGSLTSLDDLFSEEERSYRENDKAI